MSNQQTQTTRPRKIRLPDPLREALPGGRFRLPPTGMDRMQDITTEQVQAIQRIALSVFTDMSNAGYTLRETLAAIYLTGAQNAIEASSEPSLS